MSSETHYIIRVVGVALLSLFYGLSVNVKPTIQKIAAVLFAVMAVAMLVYMTCFSWR